MRISLSPTLSLLPLLAAPLAACIEPIDPANLADLAALHAREIVHQSGGGVAFTQDDSSGLEHDRERDAGRGRRSGGRDAVAGAARDGAARWATARWPPRWRACRRC